MNLRDHRICLALALIHFIVAFLFAVRTPYRQAGVLVHQGRQVAQDIGAPDERQHANYVNDLRSGKGFPIFRPGSEDLYETYQAHQPPLYYILAAGYTSMFGESASSALPMRSLNFIIGALGVVGVYFLALWAYDRRDWATWACAFAALLPMNAALSSAVSNDPLLITLSTWSLATAILGLRSGWTSKRCLVLAILLGLALLTKTNAVALILPCLLALWGTKDKALVTFKLAAMTLTILMIAPWWIRNTQLYGDPLALAAFNQAFTGSAQAAPFIRELGAFGYWTGINEYGLGVGWWTLRSLLGAFGYMDIFLPSALYGVFGVILLASCAGWALWAKQDGRASNQANIVLGLFLLTVLALFLRFNSQYFQAQARYILPALGVLSIGVVIGTTKLAGRAQNLALGAVIGGLVAALGLALYVLPDEFARRIT